MHEIIAVTNRKLCRGDFLLQIKKLAGLPIRGILLREKDLPEEQYRELAGKVLNIMVKEKGNDTPVLIIHTYVNVWKEFYGSTDIDMGLHIPFLTAKGLGTEGIKDIKENAKDLIMLGTSVHKPEEAKAAQELGMTYLLAGHVFETDCKKGVPGKGIEFIKKVCERTTLPIYGIGGISIENAGIVREAGAAGVCQMSEVMGREEFDRCWLESLGGAGYGRGKNTG